MTTHAETLTVTPTIPAAGTDVEILLTGLAADSVYCVLLQDSTGAEAVPIGPGASAPDNVSLRVTTPGPAKAELRRKDHQRWVTVAEHDFQVAAA